MSRRSDHEQLVRLIKAEGDYTRSTVRLGASDEDLFVGGVVGFFLGAAVVGCIALFAHMAELGDALAPFIEGRL